MPKINYVIALLLVAFQLAAQAREGSAKELFGFEDTAFQELSLSEWKKFKAFEQKLADSKMASPSKEQRLIGYAKDSIRILGVKLMAVKLLDEKALLRKDIAENVGYYQNLLQELRLSAIPPVEYVFLEEKMALLNQRELERQLGWSQGLNLALFGILLVLGWSAHRLIRSRKQVRPELSKQEITVRQLILEGKTNKEIANELFISLSTVKSHITNIYAKSKVSNRKELMRMGTGTST